MNFICTTGRGSCLHKDVISTGAFTCASNNQICEASFVLCNVRHSAIAASFSPQRQGLNPTVVNVGFLVGKVPDGKASVCAPPFPLINYHSTNVPYQISSGLVQQALYEATVSGDSPPPLKLLTQNLFPWWVANDTTWIIHQSHCFCPTMASWNYCILSFIIIIIITTTTTTTKACWWLYQWHILMLHLQLLNFGSKYLWIL